MGGMPGKRGLPAANLRSGEAAVAVEVTEVRRGLIGNTEVVIGDVEGLGDSGLLLLEEEVIWRPLEVAAEANAAWCKVFQCENKAGLRPNGFSRFVDPKLYN